MTGIGVGRTEVPSFADGAVAALERTFDARHGGWGGAPKFPQPMTIEFLLREHLRTYDGRPLAMARRTLDAMAAGGQLTILTANAELDAAYAAANNEAKAGDFVLISVSDTGAGMPPNVLKQVFEPFFTTKGTKGTGLGLSASHGIITRHNGEIVVVSEPGEGTRFEVRLPLAEV